jgi:hypothetical protein
MLKTHWDQYAESWGGQSLPLRPSREDLKNYEEAIRVANAEQVYNNLLVLGATPEIYHLGASMGFAPRCIDHSKSMIDSIWPGPPDSAIHGDWREIDRSVGERVIVACDGGLHLLNFDSQMRFMRCFRSGALSLSTLVLRLFLPPKQRQSTNDILEDFETRKLASISYLKVALWHSLDIQNAGVTRIRDVWEAVHQRSRGDVIGYLTSLGQSKIAVDSFLVYRDSPSSYYFHSMDRIHNMIHDSTGFKLKKVLAPKYPKGDCFPVVIYAHD